MMKKIGENMRRISATGGRKYLVIYDKSFLCSSKSPAFLPDGRRVFELAVYFEARPKDSKTGEILYCRGKGKDSDQKDGDQFGLAGAYRCSYDKKSETGYRLTKNYDIPGIEIEFVPVDYYAREDVPGIPDFIQITKEVFCKTLKEYPEAFDTSNNRSAPSDTYGIRYIED